MHFLLLFISSPVCFCSYPADFACVVTPSSRAHPCLSIAWCGCGLALEYVEQPCVMFLHDDHDETPTSSLLHVHAAGILRSCLISKVSTYISTLPLKAVVQGQARLPLRNACRVPYHTLSTCDRHDPTNIDLSKVPLNAPSKASDSCGQLTPPPRVTEHLACLYLDLCQ